MVFVEYDRHTLDLLEREVDKIVRTRPTNDDEVPTFVFLHGKFEDRIPAFLEKYKVELSRSAVFAFVDPFGYSTAPTSVIQQLLQCSLKAEVMVNVMSSYMNRFKGPLERNLSLEKALGRRIEKEEYGNWARGEGAEEIADVYVEELRRCATYTVRFGMCASKTGAGGITYHLVFASKHKRGRQMMKDAMFKFALSAPRTRNGQPFYALYYCEAKKETSDGDTRENIEIAYPYIRNEVMREFEEFIWNLKQFPFRKATIKSLVEDGSIKWYRKNDEGPKRQCSFAGESDITLTFSGSLSEVEFVLHCALNLVLQFDAENPGKLASEAPKHQWTDIAFYSGDLKLALHFAYQFDPENPSSKSAEEWMSITHRHSFRTFPEL